MGKRQTANGKWQWAMGNGQWAIGYLVNYKNMKSAVVNLTT
jgi:hypothetical protein